MFDTCHMTWLIRRILNLLLEYNTIIEYTLRKILLRLNTVEYKVRLPRRLFFVCRKSHQNLALHNYYISQTGRIPRTTNGPVNYCVRLIQMHKNVVIYLIH